MGIVTSFEITNEYISYFKTQNVGGEIHNELWIPSEEPSNFNSNIIGQIKIVNAYFGEKYTDTQNEIVRLKILKFRI